MMSSSDDVLRIGVYVCHCGTHIVDTVAVEQLAEFCCGLPGVALVRDYKYMCSEPGQELIKQDIAEHGLNRIVVAACSPLLHEKTFRKAAADAGLNPFLVHMANIREHVAWITECAGQATAQAKAHVAAAVRRVAAHEPLEQQLVPVLPRALVIGGGIAGLHAAMILANAGKKVVVVDREPAFGGPMTLSDATFPMQDYASSILASMIASVKNHPNVKLLTHAEVESVGGSAGNYKVRINRCLRHMEGDVRSGGFPCAGASMPEEIEVGAIIVTTGATTFVSSAATSEGVFLVGDRQGSGDVSKIVVQASAAATEALAVIGAGLIGREPNTAWIDEDTCSGCKTCIPLCPYSAIGRDEVDRIAVIDDALCKGCGTCVASCPTGAAQQHLFSSQEVFDEIEGIIQYV